MIKTAPSQELERDLVVLPSSSDSALHIDTQEEGVHMEVSTSNPAPIEGAMRGPDVGCLQDDNTLVGTQDFKREGRSSKEIVGMDLQTPPASIHKLHWETSLWRMEA